MAGNVSILPSNTGPEIPAREEFVRRIWIVVFIVAGAIAFALVFWRATNIFLMSFAGALLAIFLRSLANLVHRWTRMRPHHAVLLVLGCSARVVRRSLLACCHARLRNSSINSVSKCPAPSLNCNSK